jgi:hypothetical protein
MNSGSSALISVGGQSAEALAHTSWYQKSRPGVICTSPPVCFTTIAVFTVGQLAIALSALALRGTGRPPRRPSSEVMRATDLPSWMRPASESGEKPPNTTEWMAPMRAQASMANAASGIIGK